VGRKIKDGISARQKVILAKEKRKAIRIKDLENEVWKDVVGFEGLYQVSDFGRVKSLCRTTPYKDDLIHKRIISEKILKMKLMNTFYIEVMLSMNGQRNYKRVHRLVAESFIQNQENKDQINHKDGNKQNNNLSNIEWCTQSENQLHKYRYLGYTGQRGEKSVNSKLSSKQVLEIRDKKGEYSCSQLGKLYNVSPAEICLIQNKKVRKYD
jgi:hypothetical protein